MQLDLGTLERLYIGDSKVTLTFEPVGDDKVRINAANWVDPVVSGQTRASWAWRSASACTCAAPSGRSLDEHRSAWARGPRLRAARVTVHAVAYPTRPKSFACEPQV
jgi:hypothetical protein